MSVEEFKQYLIDKEHIYPDYCIKENIKYNNYEVYSPQFNNRYTGLPIFYLVDKENNIISCNKEEMFEILDLLEKTSDDNAF